MKKTKGSDFLTPFINNRSVQADGDSLTMFSQDIHMVFLQLPLAAIFIASKLFHDVPCVSVWIYILNIKGF